MINTIPDNWKYNKDLEMLFLFYQETDELLSHTTVDTYALPLHNTVTLVQEIYETYSLLKNNNAIDSYYSKYIPSMIEELLFHIQSDYLFKKIVGDRLSSICTGFAEAKDNHALLKRWLDYTMHSCSLKKYLDSYKFEIINLITTTKNKEKMLYCSKNYYVSLLDVGYTREYIYREAKHYFNNKNITIDNSQQIKDFLSIFTCKYNKYEFLVLMNVADIEYLENINENIKIGQDIKAINVAKEKIALKNDFVATDLFKQYDRMKCEEKEHEKIEIVRFFDNALDPYKAICDYSENIKYLQTFTMYFKHYFYAKRIFKILIKKEDGYYHEIHEPNKYHKRPFIEQSIIDKRVENIITGKSLGGDAKRSLSRAIEMHAESFDSRNTVALFRSLWTAFETIFIDSNPNSVHSNIVSSALAVIQKTYILKVMRTLYIQITQAIDKADLKALNIENFDSFVLYFAQNEESSEKMKAIYAFLEHNPLLRSRLYNLRKRLNTGNHIGEYLDAHKTRIEWQLRRLCVIRNIATHLGEELSGADIAINHLHNYFDYIVNFVLCKAENGDYVSSISATVFEAQNDLQTQREALKTSEKLSEVNYYRFLFGPDKNLIRYNFE